MQFTKTYDCSSHLADILIKLFERERHQDLLLITHAMLIIYPEVKSYVEGNFNKNQIIKLGKFNPSFGDGMLISLSKNDTVLIEVAFRISNNVDYSKLVLKIYSRKEFIARMAYLVKQGRR